MTQPQRWTYMERKRERAGRTMLNLAATIGRHVSVVSRYEAGLVRPSPEVFALLANALDCDIDELIASAPRPAPRAVRDPEPTTEAVA